MWPPTRPRRIALGLCQHNCLPPRRRDVVRRTHFGSGTTQRVSSHRSRLKPMITPRTGAGLIRTVTVARPPVSTLRVNCHRYPLVEQRARVPSQHHPAGAIPTRCVNSTAPASCPPAAQGAAARAQSCVGLTAFALSAREVAARPGRSPRVNSNIPRFANSITRLERPAPRRPRLSPLREEE